jgi:hypothetical protein
MAAEVEQVPPPEVPLEDEQDSLALTVQYHGQPITLTLSTEATIEDLSTLVAEDLQIPPSNQKFLVSPKPGLLRPPFKDPTLRLDSLPQKAKITLLGSTTQEVADVETAIASLKQKQQARRAALNAGRKVQASQSRLEDRDRRSNLHIRDITSTATTTSTGKVSTVLGTSA